MTKVKCIFYAYPSSIIATKCQMAKTGCYYVFVGDEDDGECSDDFPNIVFYSTKKEDAIVAAEMFNVPWGNYSMHKD